MPNEATKSLAIQIHLGLLSTEQNTALSAEQMALEFLQTLGNNDLARLESIEHGEYEEGETLPEHRKYLTGVFQTTALLNFWIRTRDALQTSAFGQTAIVVSQGSRGWDDYLLLHSFDPSEEVDVIPSVWTAEDVEKFKKLKSEDLSFLNADDQALKYEEN